jgi:hypothetical protein
MAGNAQQWLVKYPLTFASDAKTEATNDPREQFNLFLKCPVFNRLIDPNYGLEEEMFLQRNVFSIQEMSQLYMIRLKEKFNKYLKNVTITRVTSQFNRQERAIDLTIYLLINNAEEPIKHQIKNL